MSKKGRKRNRRGPNPDPARYVWVDSKEGGYWRRKRGLNKPAELNDAYRQSANSTKLTSPAAKRIVQRLGAHLRGLETGRILARMGGKLKKPLHQKGVMDYSALEGFELQPYHPLAALLDAPYKAEAGAEAVTVTIPIDKHTVKRHNGIVSHYYFDLVLLWGDPGREDGLRVESETSGLYGFSGEKKSVCALSVPLPGNGAPWMALLKVNCLEGHELAVHPRHYGMRVVKVS
jgi:hypothetical protein